LQLVLRTVLRGAADLPAAKQAETAVKHCGAAADTRGTQRDGTTSQGNTKP